MKTYHVGLAIGNGIFFNAQVLVTVNVLHIWKLVNVKLVNESMGVLKYEDERYKDIKSFLPTQEGKNIGDVVCGKQPI